MRWNELTDESGPSTPDLFGVKGLIRTVRTPEFSAVTFHEVLAKSALNKVPRSSSMPFTWTINPYRGCSHACVYCFARSTHRYLDLDAGTDFDRQVIVKVNIAEVLAAELARPKWAHEHVALGTNTDPYQRAEGRYGLMPGIITALAERSTPLSILTKGTLLRRDLPLLSRVAEDTPVEISMSIAVHDDALHRFPRAPRFGTLCDQGGRGRPSRLRSAASAAGSTRVVLHLARTRTPRAPAPLSQDVRHFVLCLEGVPSLARRAHRSPHRPLWAARIG